MYEHSTKTLFRKLLFMPIKKKLLPQSKQLVKYNLSRTFRFCSTPKKINIYFFVFLSKSNFS